MNEKDIIHNYLRSLNIIISVSLAIFEERTIIFILQTTAKKSTVLKDITLDNIVSYSIDFFKEKFNGMKQDEIIQEFEKFINNILDSIKLLTGDIVLNKIKSVMLTEGLKF